MSTTTVDAEHLTHIVDETLTDGLEVTALCGHTWTPELRDLAEQRSIDLTGLKRKADIVEAIATTQV